MNTIWKRLNRVLLRSQIRERTKKRNQHDQETAEADGPLLAISSGGSHFITTKQGEAMNSEMAMESVFLQYRLWQEWQPERPELLVRLPDPMQEEHDDGGTSELQANLLTL